MPKIVLISDTHGLHSKVKIPECDILIHAGDWTGRGIRDEVEDFAKWLDKQPATEILLTPGNHEVYFEKLYPDSLAWIYDHCPKAQALINESVNKFNIEFWASPYSPAFGSGWAYNAGRDPVEAAHLFKPFIGDIFAEIPEQTEFIICHTMPFSILDEVRNWQGQAQFVGCKELLKKCQELPKLKYFVGGHLHFNGGKSLQQGNVTYFNASICDENYRPVRKPIVIEI